MLPKLLLRTSLVARLLVALLAAGSVLPGLLHGQLADDPFCDARRGAADLAVSAAAHTDAPDHCDVCHWLRGVRSFVAAPALTVVAAGTPVAIPPACGSAAACPAVPVVPARAPPADLLA